MDTYELVEPNVWVIKSSEEVLGTYSLAPITSSTTTHSSSQPQGHIIAARGSSWARSVVVVLAV